MGIIVHEETGLFHLQNKEISYIIKCMPNGQLGQLYYGKALHDRADFPHMLERAHRDMAPCVFDGDTTFSLEHLKQEYPAFGTGDMRYPAYSIKRMDGSHISEFLYKGYRVVKGKKPLTGLPAVYVEQEEEADTLELLLEDPVLDVKLQLNYTIFKDFSVIARSAVFENGQKDEICLEQAMSISLDLPDCNYEMVDLAGASLRERHVDSHRLHQGVQSIHSLRGHSSHQFNPFLALKRPETNENSGEVIGVSLVYSGNFLGQAEVDTMGTTRITLGIHPKGFEWPLAVGESFQTPEAVLVYSNDGLNGMSQIFHKLYRTRLARGYWRDRERPILVNNWEATYMDFDEEKILSIGRKAKELGIELFVLDDGWFGKRNDDTSSLGDWYPNLEKLPDGITGIADKITQLGLKFGLWFEPEMVSRNSELYREHPDWILGSTDRHICCGRHQYVLDFSKKEVVDYIGGRMVEILNCGKISYVKWDMNRSISDLFSAGTPAKEQGTIYHRQILGIYALYERLTQTFPEILFESCASGGGRFDPGMLYYAPQAWTSDNTDGTDRIMIQYGSSMVYPLSSISNHVSAVPNHQSGRMVSMKTRGITAFLGAFGYELDLNMLSEEEQEEVKEQILFVKKYRGMIQKGTFYRLRSPFEGNEAAWMVVSEDQKIAIAAYFRLRQPCNVGYSRLKLKGLNADAKYRISDRDYKCYGDELMEAGLILSDRASGVRTSPIEQQDGLARIFVLEQADGNEA